MRNDVSYIAVIGMEEFFPRSGDVRTFCQNIFFQKDGEGNLTDYIKTAFIFPGQDSQYTDIFKNLTIQLPQGKEIIERYKDNLSDSLAKPLSDNIYQPEAFSAKANKTDEATLTQSDIAQASMGDIPAMETFKSLLKEKKIMAQDLPSKEVNHTPLAKDQSASLTDGFGTLAITPPKTPVNSPDIAAPHPNEPDKIHKPMVDHWLNTLKFRETIEQKTIGCMDLNRDEKKIFKEKVSRKKTAVIWLSARIAAKDAIGLFLNTTRKCCLLPADIDIRETENGFYLYQCPQPGNTEEMFSLSITFTDSFDSAQLIEQTQIH